MMEQQIIYFSGPHGAGKSSLITSIAKAKPDNFAIYPDRLEFAKTENPLQRNRAKYIKYYHEYLDQLNFGKKTLGKTVLGDRCVYDGIVYGRAFSSLGWVSSAEQNANEQIGRLLFDGIMPENLCVLNPPLETIVKRLASRWESKDKKWREEDFRYLEAAHRGYQNIANIFEGKNLLIIDEDISLRAETDSFIEWADKGGIVLSKNICQHI